MSKNLEPLETSVVPFSGRVGIGITDRQFEVLCWLALGKSNAAIGAILGISAAAVDHHVTALFRRLSCSSRAHAVLIACRTGIL